MKNLPDILIVDDDVDLCTIICAKLKNLGTFHTEATLAGAKRYLKAERPGLMLLDNNLPDGEGARLIQEFKILYPELKIIMITADTDEDLKRQSLAAGASLFLQKPFNIQTMIDGVQGVLASAR